MLNAFFIFQSETGTLLYDKVFFQEMDESMSDMFSGFLIALKTFISKMFFDGSKVLKSINLGDYHVVITHINEINSELVMVVDKEEDKSATKIIPKIVEIILNNKELFNESEGSSEQFKIFDEQVNNLIIMSKNIVEETLLDQKSDVFKSIWAQRGKISANLREDLLIEKEDLYNKLANTQNYIEKSVIFEEIIEVLNKLDATEELIRVQAQAKAVKDEIKDRRIRLKYFLKETKDALKYKNYKVAYSNFYSFSAKLRNLTQSHVQKKYADLANSIMNKDNISHSEFSKIISEILNIPDNIVDETLLDQKNDVLKSLGAQKGKISVKLQKELNIKKEDLYKKIGSTHNYIEKSVIFDQIIEVLNKLDATEELSEIQAYAKALKDEIEDRRIKLQYFLKETKEALKKKNYKIAYSNLFSFSSKLRNLAKSPVQKKYANLANSIMNKDNISRVEFSQIIYEILLMPDNIDEYLN